jgi:D-alanyl-D-alanine carboxypeptidase
LHLSYTNIKIRENKEWGRIIELYRPHLLNYFVKERRREQTMNKKSVLGLILFAILITTSLFVGANFLIDKGSKANTDLNQTDIAEDDIKDNSTEIVETDENTQTAVADANSEKVEDTQPTISAETEIAFQSNADILAEEPWLSANPSDIGTVIGQEPSELEGSESPEDSASDADDTFSTSVKDTAKPQLILDCNEVDYKAFIPEMISDSELEAALDITNPSISIDAEAAILFDADTKEVLFYKNPVLAEFPASTAKLLTSVVALEWCKQDEEVTLGDEVKMIASDSTRANIHPGQILTIRNLLEGMLLPSGNDAAYAVATFVGRKSLQSPGATKEEAVEEFIRLMNEKAKKLGVKNSCFKTPDGYDAIGQYTTAYDMGLIGIAAAKNETIIEISQKSRSRNIFVSGEDVTWNSTNKLITKYSGQYYSKAIGLKTGTSTMAGRCIVAAAESDGKEVVCVIMDSSTAAGRWEDAIELLKYGLD